MTCLTKYFLLLVDDYSKKSWIYFLKEKGQIFDKFIEFKEMIEKKTEKLIERLGTDDGGELTTHNFSNFCTRNGIIQQLTQPYTS